MKQRNLLLTIFMNDPKPQFILSYPSLKIAYANNAAKMVYHHPFTEGTSILDFHPDIDSIIEQHNKASYFNHQDTIVVNRQLLKLNFSFFKVEEQHEVFYRMTVEPYFEPLHRTSVKRISKYCQGNGIVLTDKELNIIEVNQTYMEMFGFDRNDVIGKSIVELFDDNDQEALKNELKGVIVGGIVQHTIHHKYKNRSPILTDMIATPYFIQHCIEGAQFFFRSALPVPTHSDSIFKAIINNYKDGVIITDKERNIIWVNPAFTRITGYTFDEVLGKNPRLLKSGIQSGEFYREMWERILQTDHFFGELWNRKKNGEIYPQWTDFITLRDERGEIQNYVSIFKDLDDVDAVNRNILLMLQKDPLTLVYNRTYFLDLANRMIQKLNGSTAYLLFLDINNYKPINDTHGHFIGDQVLIKYAQSLLQTFKTHMIGRYGGDEFLILTTSPVSRENLIQTISQFNPKFEIENNTFHVSTSFGIVEITDSQKDINELINMADYAMYLAKRKRFKYLFYSDISTE